MSDHPDSKTFPDVTWRTSKADVEEMVETMVTDKKRNVLFRAVVEPVA